MKRLVVFSVASWAIVLLSGSPAHAQATRTWVSGVGDDANPCSRTAPCKTFAGAISKTAAGGEIDALDPGGFGAVTITKAITIDGGGMLAGVLVSGTNGIVVNAGVNDVITLRGLDINGIGTGLNGIRFLAGAGLNVENSVIFKFTTAGIDFEPNGTAHLMIKDCVIRDNAGGGVLVKPTVAGFAHASLQNVRLEHNLFGLRAEDRSRVAADGSVFADNTNNGLLAFSGGFGVEVNVQGSLIANNGTNGVSSANSGATVRLTTNTIVNNNVGLNASGGGAIVSFGNNRVAGNTAGDGAPTSTISEQ